MNGILLVDKPMGITSQTLVAKVKHLLHLSKVGHVGTLDPLATGLMVLLLGEATKLSNYIISDDKTYLATITIGKATDTEDRMGKIVSQKMVEDRINVDEILKSLNGDLLQKPPMFSSVHHQGKKLYQYAYQGQEIERIPRLVKIHEIKRVSMITYQNNEAEFSFIANVSKGTYIRTLCVEIGTRLNYPAHMKELKRIKSGKWSLDQAYSLEDIASGKYKLISMLEALDGYFTYEVSQNEVKDIFNGRPLLINDNNIQEQIIVVTYEKKLLGIYEKEQNIYKARRIWN